MKKNLPSMIVLVVAVISLFALAFAGAFDPRPLARVEHVCLSLHWSFWCLLTICAIAGGVLLWRQGAFSRILVKLPGMDVYNPIDTAADSEEGRTFDDVAGCEEAIAKLRRVARWLKSPLWYEHLVPRFPEAFWPWARPAPAKRFWLEL